MPASRLRPLFVYGTLVDEDVRAAVLGRRIAAERLRAARLSGFCRRYRAGATYPILVSAPAGVVDGILVAGLCAADLRRLIAFEGDEYALVERTVDLVPGGTAPAHLFLPEPWVPAGDADWALPDWRRRHKRRYLAAITGGPI